jgi:cytochrome c biogenesis protein
VIRRAAAELRRQRYRVLVRANTVAAERGYLREAGNLLFHVSLLGLLLGVSIGALFAFRGSAVVTVGQGFSNNLTQYDDFTAGAWFRPDTLTPFSLTVASFDARFETGPVQRGAARLFRGELDVTDTPGAAPRRTTLEVNRPLKVGGTSVYLIGHGYAPLVTVRDATGAVAFSGPVVFLPQDGNFTSLGVIKVPDARPQRLAFQGIFVPTSVPGQKPTSAFPDEVSPALYVNAFAGPPAVETGTPESVYSLNTTGMTQLRNPDGSVVAVRLVPGTSFTLPDGQGSIQLDGWTRWVKLQVGDSPGVAVVFGSVAAAVTGLCLSLFVRPRRIWVRATNRPGRLVLVETAGLDRADARTGLNEEVEHLTALLAGPHQPQSLHRSPIAKERP